MPPRRLVILIAVALLFRAPVVAAADPPPGVDAAIRRGVGYLKKAIPSNPRSGQSVLGALALVKAGEPIDDPAVRAVIEAVQARCADTKYKPDGHHYYTAGLEMMLLEAVDPDRFRVEMEKILTYILAGQRENGAWFYPNQEGPGDTSITQYATLGLWAAERAGLTVPKPVWDKMAIWHLRTQLPNGAFAYHPGEANSSEPSAALTLGGAANLLLVKLNLFGKSKGQSAEPASPSKREIVTGKRFGVLEPVDLDEPEDAQPQPENRKVRIQSTPALLQKSIDRAVMWSAASFQLPPPTTWRMYYLYGLERLGALGDLSTLGPHDWYGQGARWLVGNQQEDGSWALDSGDRSVSAAFGVLFLTRSTSRMLGRNHGVPELGGGILAGGRGLPDDLGRIAVSKGEVRKRSATGPIDDLLARLEDAQAADVPAAQNEILEAVRFGDRESLIDQRDRLRRLVDDPRSEVRRTAFWALGRGGELSDTPRLIKGLSDPDIAVAIEAHNALCVLSRRPLAFGIPGDPRQGMQEDASEAEREQAIATWREKAVESWSEWYRSVAPYEERDGLGLFR